jgi:ribosomal protein L16/L10AE
MLFELEGVPLEEAKAAFRLASSKLPVKAEFVERVVM